uniref:Protein kinase domain-containing protein n=1 Tax=Meloidogyne hapla TaxID=6305 RepID=A0A1I8BKX3_MELHA
MYLIRSNCTFGPITFSEQRSGFISQPKCVCSDGNAIEPNSSSTCQIACLLVISLFLSLICCFKIIYNVRGRRKKLSPSPSADVHELIAIVSSGTDNRPVASNDGNCLYSDMNYGINRIIGHGAFGEVFEGWLLMGDGDTSLMDVDSLKEKHCNGKRTEVKVAIKSLPLESAHDFGDDFETEARLLRLIFSKTLIVLEFLEGGDLKNFLRENRPRQQDGLFTSKTDVWAYGVLLWEIFSLGYIPYPGRDNLEVMRLVVAGDRLDPPIGIPDEIYELMLRCWNTESEQRPNFVDLVGTFETLLKNKDLVAEPLPPMRNRLINERSVSGTPSISSRACDAQPTSTISQATISTGVYSSNGWTGACSSTSTYETMPIIGDGVCRAVFPPYQSRQSEEKFIRLYDKKRSEEKSSDECASQDESAGQFYNRCFRWSRRPSLPDTTLPNEQRDHSLPPFPSMRSTTVRQCDDQDSGIASARSFGGYAIQIGEFEQKDLK